MGRWYVAKVQAKRYENAATELAFKERDLFKLEKELLSLEIKKLKAKNKEGDNSLGDKITETSDRVSAFKSEVEALREALSVTEAKTKEVLMDAPILKERRSRVLTDILDVVCMFYSAKWLGRTYVCHIGSIDLELAESVRDMFSLKFNAKLVKSHLYEVYYNGVEVKAVVIPRSSWAMYKHFPTTATKPKTAPQPRSIRFNDEHEASCSTSLPRATGRHIRFSDEDEEDCSTSLPRGTGKHLRFNSDSESP